MTDRIYPSTEMRMTTTADSEQEQPRRPARRGAAYLLVVPLRSSFVRIRRLWQICTWDSAFSR